MPRNKTTQSHRLNLFLSCLWGIVITLAPQSGAVEIVLLKSGGTLLAEGHQERGEMTEVALMSGAKVFIDNTDIDRITLEETESVQIADLEIDPEKLLPDTTDPLNFWLDAKPSESKLSKRLYLSFNEQVDQGEELPLARSMGDVRLARKRRVPQIEFADKVLYLGMDLQYHENPGLTFEESFKKLRTLEKVPNLEEVSEFIGEVRRSAKDRRKEQVISDAIRLREYLEPVYAQQSRQNEGYAAQAERFRQGIQPLRQ